VYFFAISLFSLTLPMDSPHLRARLYAYRRMCVFWCVSTRSVAENSAAINLWSCMTYSFRKQQHQKSLFGTHNGSNWERTGVR
jgi:hypothetical protein